jgi:hypothetical protein
MHCLCVSLRNKGTGYKNTFITKGADCVHRYMQTFSWGRCYDTIFCQKKQCYDQNFSKFSYVWNQKRPLFVQVCRENILK